MFTQGTTKGTKALAKDGSIRPWGWLKCPVDLDIKNTLPNGPLKIDNVGVVHTVVLMGRNTTKPKDPPCLS